MTLTKATALATEEGRKILEASGFKDGVDDDYLASTGVDVGNKPCYYYTRSDTNRKDGTSLLALWDITSITGTGKADNRTAMRYIAMQISFYTEQDRTSGTVQEVLGKMEAEAEKLGYEVNLQASDSFDLVRRITIISYRLTKTVM